MSHLKSLKPLFRDESLLVDFKPEEDQIKTMYKHYIEDFVTNPIKVNGKQVVTFSEKSKIKLFSNFPETFIHLITREIKYANQRFYDCNRANRIHWIKPILESYTDKSIFYYRWKDEKGIVKDHFWLFEKDFLIVLKEYKTDYRIITAFLVDNDDKIKFFERYKNFKEEFGDK